MSFPYSRTDIQQTNPYSIFTRCGQSKYVNPKKPNQPIINHCSSCNLSNVNKLAGFATQIPFHGAYTPFPERYLGGRLVILPSKISANNPSLCGPNMVNMPDKTQEVADLLARNRSISNPYNTYPFYDDPSVMWSAQVTYNPMC